MKKLYNIFKGGRIVGEILLDKEDKDFDEAKRFLRTQYTQMFPHIEGHVLFLESHHSVIEQEKSDKKYSDEINLWAMRLSLTDDQNVIKQYLEEYTQQIQNQIYNKPIDIELRDWMSECGEPGCCTDYGTELLMNLNVLEHPDHTAEDYVSGQYIGDDVTQSLRAVLKKLGYTNVNVERTVEDKDE